MQKGLDINLEKSEKDLKDSKQNLENSKPYFVEVPDSESLKPSEREIMLLKNLYLWLVDRKPNGITEYKAVA